ncbi:MAG: YegS/Rv2252/BmrU family lipid kinase [Bacteroidales bacterium]|nr:YegS/Rv2252/BmrU family lipid kinase [Bacteroidales bacterium]
MKKVAFIVNPASGIKGKAFLGRYIERSFHHRTGWIKDIYHTKGPDDAYRAALHFKATQVDLVVAVGGDGTVNQVARALVHAAIPMGIIPTGSGNGLARHLGIPRSVPKAVDVILQQHVAAIDSGAINGQPFFCTAGIGFDANLANRFNRAPIRGFPSYIALSAWEYTHYRPEKYKIFTGDCILEREAFLITFANCSQWGNNVYIAPGASATDGLLDMVIWKSTSVVRIPFTAVRLLARNINHSKHIENFRGTSFSIERACEGPVHYDGEHALMGRELKVEAFPASLKMVMPCLY